jgi:hypothetical protein
VIIPSTLQSSNNIVCVCVYRSETVLYGYETWFLSIREKLNRHETENKLRLLNRIVGPKMDEVDNSLMSG